MNYQQAISKVNAENRALAKLLGSSDTPSIMAVIHSMKNDPQAASIGQPQSSMTSSNLKQFNDMNSVTDSKGRLPGGWNNASTVSFSTGDGSSHSSCSFDTKGDVGAPLSPLSPGLVSPLGSGSGSGSDISSSASSSSRGDFDYDVGVVARSGEGEVAVERSGGGGGGGVRVSNSDERRVVTGEVATDTDSSNQDRHPVFKLSVRVGGQELKKQDEIENGADDGCRGAAGIGAGIGEAGIEE